MKKKIKLNEVNLYYIVYNRVNFYNIEGIVIG